MQDIFNTVLKKHKVSSEQKKKIFAEIKDFIEKIIKSAAQNKINIVVELGGSAAKRTFLKQDFDCDIFVRFDLSYKNKDISKLLKKILKPFPKAILVHGSRDYFQIHNDIKFEVIPVLNIKDPKEALNVTDTSPLHVSWIKTKLKDNLADQIMLAKLFCKAGRIYGAESYITGFSGHVLDILLVEYKTFKELLNNASKWEDRVIIDTEKSYKDKTEILKKLNSAKKVSPLIAIDPVQKDRNAAAALSKECFEKFKTLARQFLEKPSIDYFIKKEISESILQKKAGNKKLIMIKIKAKKGKEDIIGAKILKVYEHIKKRLADFIILESDWSFDKKESAFLYYCLKKDRIEKEYLRQGPLISQTLHVDKFKEKNKKTFIKDKRIYAMIKRKHTEPEPLIKDILKETHIKAKIRSGKLV